MYPIDFTSNTWPASFLPKQVNPFYTFKLKLQILILLNLQLWRLKFA